ncbi:MAG: acetate--CoA ligase family protein [Deltaproteobacteria bacterium]|nr:acetate--CoA ligase family protein [Deltaproteobacteria bacterium]
MRELFYPNTVAVIGVSSSNTNIGLTFDFQGIIYEVGPKGGVLAGRRIYKSVLDIPDHVDLAVILTPAATVPDILEECGQKGIRWAIVESAGFREYGEEGKKIEDEIVRVAKKWNLRFVGPNCIGLVNMENGLCCPFTPLNRAIRLGDISMISQSGGVGISIMNLMANEGLGLNKFASVGNMLNIEIEELLSYFIEDPGTKYILLYLEGIRDGRRLMEVARKSPKPVLAFKANIGQYGKSIASSHTASLSSNDRVVDAAFRQVGIVRVDDATTLGNNLKILHLQPMLGKNLAIIARSGGHAVIAADACEMSGLNLAAFPKDFLDEIEKHFRASVIKLTNPLDLGDLFDLDIYAKIIETTLAQKEVDGIIFLHTSISPIETQATRDLFKRVIELSKKQDKPVAIYISTDDQEISYLKRSHNYPVFTQVVETVRALELNRRYHAEKKIVQQPQEIPSFKVDKKHIKPILEKARSEKRDPLLHEAVEVLKLYGIPIAEGVPVKDKDEAIEAAKKLGFPVAMKIISEQISHKSDVGGVQLNLRSEKGVADAHDDMIKRILQAYPDKNIDGMLIQSMVTGGRELIIGGRQDEQFGPVVMIGLGGIFVEILGEISLRVAPISRRDALDMIHELRGSAIFEGARGTKPSDIEAVVDVLLRLSQLLCEFPEVKELDINPLRVFHQKKGCIALDARIILDKEV